MVAYRRSDGRDVRSVRSGCMTVEQWSKPWSLFSSLKQDEIGYEIVAIVTALQAARDRALSDFRNGRVSARHPSLDIPWRRTESGHFRMPQLEKVLIIGVWLQFSPVTDKGAVT